MNISQTERNYRLQLAQNGMLEVMKREGKLSAGGYAVGVTQENGKHLTWVVPVDRAKDAKKLKKEWRQSGLSFTFFHLTINPKFRA